MKTGFILLIILLMGGMAMAEDMIGKPLTTGDKAVHAVFVGASVGNAWDFPAWPARMNRPDCKFEMIPVYSFDKSGVLEEIFIRPKRKFKLNRTYLKSLLKPALQKPDFIMIKECAAYFPGDMDKYKALVKKWHQQCRDNDIKLVLATVVPVTVERDSRQPGKLKGILEFNDWMKNYSKTQNVPVVDLESVTRISAADRSLRPDLSSGDGLHLNEKAYAILDDLFMRFFSLFAGN